MRVIDEPRRPELYNIVDDPLEEHDLWDEHPQRGAKLLNDIETWFDEVEAERRTIPDDERIGGLAYCQNLRIATPTPTAAIINPPSCKMAFLDISFGCQVIERPFELVHFRLDVQHALIHVAMSYSPRCRFGLLIPWYTSG